MTTPFRPSQLFRNALDAFISARQRQADAYVTRALLSSDDETLRRNGYSRSQLQRRASRYPIF